MDDWRRCLRVRAFAQRLKSFVGVSPVFLRTTGVCLLRTRSHLRSLHHSAGFPEKGPFSGGKSVDLTVRQKMQSDSTSQNALLEAGQPLRPVQPESSQSGLVQFRQGSFPSVSGGLP